MGGLGGGGGLASRLLPAGVPAAAVPLRPPALAALAAVRRLRRGRLRDPVAERRPLPRRHRALLPRGQLAPSAAGGRARRRRLRLAAPRPAADPRHRPDLAGRPPAADPRGGAPAGQVVRVHGGHGGAGVRHLDPDPGRRLPVPGVRADPGVGGHRRVQVPAVRDRPADQPHPGLRAAHRPAGRRLRQPGVPARAPARPGHRRLGPGRGCLHPGRGRPVPAGPPAGPGAGRPALQPAPLRRRPHCRAVQRPPPRPGRPRHPDRRAAGRGRPDGPAGLGVAVAAERPAGCGQPPTPFRPVGYPPGWGPITAGRVEPRPDEEAT